MKYILSFLLLIFSVAQSVAQLSTTSKRAIRLYEDSKEYFARRDFNKGLSMLEDAVAEDPKFTEAYWALANNHKIMGNIDRYERYLRLCIESAPNDKRFASGFSSVAYLDLQKGKYQDAKVNFEKYLSFNPAATDPQLPLAKKYLGDCKYALENIKKPLNFKPQAVNAVINSRFPLIYFPVLSADQQMMIFTARISSENDENIYISRKANNEWQSPEFIKELGSPFNEGTCSISADGKILIFTACEGGNDERELVGSCDLFIAYNVGGKWTKPRNMGQNVNSVNWDSQPSLTADGRTLYFISNRAGGRGGSDIWKTKLNEKGEWGKAENLGVQVNTRYNELGVFMHVNGKTMFFASDGYAGFGGSDLYKTELQSNNSWKTPENLGYPINDYRNQMGLFITADGKKGYYSNEVWQGDLMTASKLFEFELPEEMRIKGSNYVKGIVYDSKTKKKLQAKIDLYNLENDSIESTVRSDATNGDYLTVINQGTEYALYVNKEGYLFQSLSFNAANEGKDVTIDIYLDPIEKGASIVLNNIFFETGKWDLQDKSKTELNRVVAFMNANPLIKIEISGHTDDVGSHNYNVELSRKRAQSVADYLSKTGIDIKRTIAKGYGETKPKKPNTSDENRALNRRIEFQVL